MSTMKKQRSIFAKSALMAALTSAFAMSSQVSAEESEKAEEVERIEVTGSRIKRVDLEGAAPITVLKADDLIKAGFATVGEALRDSNLNAFGSWGGGSNNDWSSQSTVQLKGASAQHTLTLLDGKRMAKSPVLDGGASNMNMIPMAAVERIEILTDGASAIYGTDAIAGVINVILKKDFEGVSIDGRVERPDRPGGDSESFSFTGGLSSEKGNLVFTFERYQNDLIMMRDRDYLKAHVLEGGNPDEFQSWVNVSQTGRTITQGWAGGYLWEHPYQGDASCSEVYGDAFIGPLKDLAYPGDTSCAYDYTRNAAYSSAFKRDNTMLHYTYEVTEDIELTARAYWAKTVSMDISAPTPDFVHIPDGLPAYTTPEGIELTEIIGYDSSVWVDPYAGIRYRFDTAGDRVAESEDTVYDYLIGLKGSTDSFDWDVSVNYNNYSNHVWGTGYLLDGAQNDLVGHWDEDLGEFVGWDPRDPNSALPDGAKANYNKRRLADYLDISGGVSFEMFELPGGMVGAYVGASYQEQSIDSQVDALADAGLIKGGNGGSGGEAERDVTSAFFEMNFPVIEGLDVNVAGRYDDYSDFGDTFNPQMSISYKPMDSLLIRASAGRGFRAPTLVDLYQSSSEGYPRVTNYIACYEAGEDIDSCERSEYPAVRSSGNPELQPEESETTNIGVVWDITENISMTADYWTLDTSGLITSIGAGEILETQAELYKAADEAGVARPHVNTVYPFADFALAGNGKIDFVYNPMINLGASERAGLDISFDANFETEYGDFKFGADFSKYLDYKYTYSDSGIQVLSDDIAGRDGTPDLRVNINVAYTLGDHSVTYFANHIASQQSWSYNEKGNADSGYFEIDSYTSHNLTYTYFHQWNGSVSLGVTNLTDEDPRFDKDGTFQGNLYSARSRVFHMSFKQSF